MREIIGNTTATPSPAPDWKQTDSSKADYIKNKPDIEDVLRYTPQSLTYEQKVQVRTNIGAAALADGMQLKPEFAQTIEECIDTNKLYVLPDGYIYAYMYTEEVIGEFTNVLNIAECEIGVRLSTTGQSSTSDGAGYFVTNYIPISTTDKGKLLRYKNTKVHLSTVAFHIYDSSKSRLGTGSYYSEADTTIGVDENGDDYITLGYGYDSSGVKEYDATKMAYIRLCFAIPDTGIESVIVTIDEPIVDENETIKVYRWANTGHAFVPADYEDRIIEIKDDVENLKEVIENLPDFKGEDYILTDEDKDEIVQSILKELQGVLVLGTVDENNIIKVTSQLTDGTYTLKYENADGTLTEIGTIIVGTGTGAGGGGDGNEPIAIVNLLETAVGADGTVFNGNGYMDEKYLTGSNSSVPIYVANESGAAHFVTGYIPYTLAQAQARTPIYIKGVNIDTSNSHERIGLYPSLEYAEWCDPLKLSESGISVTKLADNYFSIKPPSDPISYGQYQFTEVNYIRFSLSGSGEGVIITVGQEIPN